MKKKTGKEEIKIAFHGDQYASDVHWSQQEKCWDGIAIIEELSLRTDEYSKIDGVYDVRMDPYLPNNDVWGPDFFLDAGVTQS